MQYLGLQHLQLFQSTPPARGATSLARAIHSWTLHFNPRPPRGGATVLSDRLSYMLVISIHAPREGGDWRYPRSGGRLCDFNPRPPRGGRPDPDIDIPCTSTISIHAPREGGDATVLPPRSGAQISIHAPREGGDTIKLCAITSHTVISIHAPREGGDDQVTGLDTMGNISIHAPREGGDFM